MAYCKRRLTICQVGPVAGNPLAMPNPIPRCRRDDGNPSAPLIRSRTAHAAILATWMSMPPFWGGHACPGTLELKIVSNRVRRDVAGRPVDAAAVAGRRSAEIEPLDRRACSRQQGMG